MKRRIPDVLRFKLKAVARNHGVRTTGLDNFDIVARILDNSTALKKEDEEILDEVCKVYDCTLEFLKGGKN